MFKGFSNSVIGASHEKRGMVCQDSSAFKIGSSFAVAVVADGHGSKKHFRSNMGSAFAVEATVETIERFYADTEEFEANFPQNHKMIIQNIQKQIISCWNAKVNRHIKANPVTAEEKSNFTPEEFENIPVESYYGTTLVAAVSGPDYTFGFQIGDGSLVGVYENGETEILIDYEESNPANITSSMCNSNAASMFDSFYVNNEKILALFVSTDGLYTSFGSDKDFLDYHTIILGQLAESDSFEDTVVRNLKKRAHYGTEDDISLSCVYNYDMSRENADVLKNKIAENKQCNPEN